MRKDTQATEQNKQQERSSTWQSVSKASSKKRFILGSASVQGCWQVQLVREAADTACVESGRRAAASGNWRRWYAVYVSCDHVTRTMTLPVTSKARHQVVLLAREMIHMQRQQPQRYSSTDISIFSSMLVLYKCKEHACFVIRYCIMVDSSRQDVQP